MVKDSQEIVVVEVRECTTDPKMLDVTATSFYGEYDDSGFVDAIPKKHSTDSKKENINKPDEPQKDRLVEILNFIGNKIIVTHDHGFEIFYLNKECDSLNVGKFTNTVIDTRKLAKLIHPKSPSFELNYLIFEVYGISAPICYREKVALLFFNLLVEAQKKGIYVTNAAIFTSST